MLQGYYSAASGMSAALQNQDILAENLAHAPVPGYRRQSLAFEAHLESQEQPGGKAAPPRTLHGVKAAQTASSFLPGSYQRTGDPLECALQGDGFFVLDGPKGELYTRNGQFQIDGDGRLVSHGGYPVAGSNGALRIPANAARIVIGQDGTVTADGTTVGQLRLASFADPQQLTRAGTTLFTAPAGVEPQAASPVVRQGYREGSNVEVVHEMVQMIAGIRQYEAAAKALRSLSDAMQQRVNAQM